MEYHAKSTTSCPTKECPPELSVVVALRLLPAATRPGPGAPAPDTAPVEPTSAAFHTTLTSVQLTDRWLLQFDSNDSSRCSGIRARCTRQHTREVAVPGSCPNVTNSRQESRASSGVAQQEGRSCGRSGRGWEGTVEATGAGALVVAGDSDEVVLASASGDASSCTATPIPPRAPSSCALNGGAANESRANCMAGSRSRSGQLPSASSPRGLPPPTKCEQKQTEEEEAMEHGRPL